MKRKVALASVSMESTTAMITASTVPMATKGKPGGPAGQVGLLGQEQLSAAQLFILHGSDDCSDHESHPHGHLIKQIMIDTK